MSKLLYEIPKVNELFGEEAEGINNLILVEHYLKGLQDSGVVDYAQILPEPGEDGLTRYVEIHLKDLSIEEIIDKTLREAYKAHISSFSYLSR